MVDFQMVKSPVRWTFFLIFVAMIVTIILGIDFSLNILNIHVSSLIVSIVAGLFSGAVLILFDIIVFQGVHYNENQKERRMRTIFIDTMHSPKVRLVIREEVEKVIKKEK